MRDGEKRGSWDMVESRKDVKVRHAMVCTVSVYQSPG